jgi:nucleoside-diphosphate-sugar epimerase
MKHYVVFGGNGFIGKHLVREISKHARVTTPSRKDLEQHAKIGSLIQKADCVFWLIQPSEHLQRLFSELQQSRCFIFISTIILYPSSTRRQDEDTELEPVSEYEKAKFEEERYLKELFRHHPERLRIVRLANTYGDVKNKGVISKIFSSVYSDEVISIAGDGSIRRDFLFVDDAARLLSRLARYRSSEQLILNVCSGRAHSLREIVRTVEKLAKRKLPVRYGTPVAGKATIIGSTRRLSKLFDVKVNDIDSGLKKTSNRYRKHFASRR